MILYFEKDIGELIKRDLIEKDIFKESDKIDIRFRVGVDKKMIPVVIAEVQKRNNRNLNKIDDR